MAKKKAQPDDPIATAETSVEAPAPVRTANAICAVCHTYQPGCQFDAERDDWVCGGCRG